MVDGHSNACKQAYSDKRRKRSVDQRRFFLPCLLYYVGAQDGNEVKGSEVKCQHI